MAINTKDVAYGGYIPEGERWEERESFSKINYPTKEMSVASFIEAYGGTPNRSKNKQFSFRVFSNGEETGEKMKLRPSKEKHIVKILLMSECFIIAGVVYNDKDEATYEFFMKPGDLMGLFICKAGEQKPAKATEWIDYVYKPAV